MITIRMEITIATIGRRTGNSASMALPFLPGGRGFLQLGSDLGAGACLQHAEHDDAILGLEPLFDDTLRAIQSPDLDAPHFDLVLLVDQHGVPALLVAQEG